jgi:hypothetical protein
MSRIERVSVTTFWDCGSNAARVETSEKPLRVFYRCVPLVVIILAMVLLVTDVPALTFWQIR